MTAGNSTLMDPRCRSALQERTGAMIPSGKAPWSTLIFSTPY
jgi:hypothetical protein